MDRKKIDLKFWIFGIHESYQFSRLEYLKHLFYWYVVRQYNLYACKVRYKKFLRERDNWWKNTPGKTTLEKINYDREKNGLPRV